MFKIYMSVMLTWSFCILGGQFRRLALNVQIEVEASITTLLVSALESAEGGGDVQKVAKNEIEKLSQEGGIFSEDSAGTGSGSGDGLENSAESKLLSGGSGGGERKEKGTSSSPTAQPFHLWLKLVQPSSPR